MPATDPRTGSRGNVRLALLLTLGAGVIACGGGDASPQGGAGGGGGRGGGRGGDPNRVIPVEVVLAELATVARTLSATGAIEPIRTVGVNSQLGGALTRVAVEEGSSVAAGALLAQVDSRELEAQLASVNANLALARRTFERSQELMERGFITAVEFERDQAAYAAARATQEQLSTRVGFASVRAPIAGVILDKRIEAGDIVSPQQRLFTIGDVSTLVVRIPVSEMDVAGLRAGDPVDISIDALEGRVIPGRIRRVFPSADSVTRLVPVEVALTGTAARSIRPGFLARAVFRLDPRTGVLMVPGAAVLEDGSGAVVYRVANGKAARTRVERGSSYQGRIEIVSGLSPGDTIVVAGNTMLRDGSNVRIVDAPVLGDSPAAATPGVTAGALPTNGGTP
jgi:membrane fusion protein, multidrug efflux system